MEYLLVVLWSYLTVSWIAPGVRIIRKSHSYRFRSQPEVLSVTTAQQPTAIENFNDLVNFMNARIISRCFLRPRRYRLHSLSFLFRGQSTPGKQ